MRERVAELALATVLLVALSTEALSALQALTAFPVYIIWLAIAILWGLGLRKITFHWKWDAIAGPLALTACGIWLIEGLTAILSPPNSSDAMAYHMPRVIYWMQQRSVEFFATPYLNQITLQPLHEYLTLHLYLLNGSDRFANCVAWMSTGLYILTASLISKSLGAGIRGQAFAAFLAATLPNGILQASGAKNEALLSFLLTCLVYFSLNGNKWKAAAALGLACFTKGTAFLFGAPLLLLLLPKAIPQAAVALLIINGPFFLRNMDLSGSPLGFDSAHADGRYRWRNEYLSWQPLASNLTRHLSEQLGSGNSNWNIAVYNTAISAHTALGLNPNDTATTWPLEKFSVPKRAAHETDANNRWHLGLIVLSIAILFWHRDWRTLTVLLALALGFLAFCFYLKWQPFMSRMFLPLFVIGVSTAAVALSRLHWLVHVAIFILLIDSTRIPLLKSWIRPLMGPENIFQLTREDLYYNDMKSWNFRPKYDEVIKSLRQSDCRHIAMDINLFQLEYPVLALLLKDHPDTRFVHINTTNPSKKFEIPSAAAESCAVVCLACENWLRK